MYGLKAAGSIVTGGAALFGGKAALDMLRSKGVMGAARSILGGAGSVAGGAGGIAAGIAHGVSENRERVNAVRQGFSGGTGQVSTAANTAGSVAGAVSGAVAGGINGRSAVQQSQNPGNSNAGPASSSPSREDGIRNGAAAESPSNAPGQEISSASPRPSSSAPVMPNLSEQPQSSESIGSAPQNYQPDTPSPATEPQITATGTQQPTQNSTDNPSPSSDSIGSYIRSKVTGGIQQSKPVKRTQRVYGLTRGSMQKHGDKVVERETRAQTLMQSDAGLSHHQAIKQAKHDIKSDSSRGR